MGKNPGINTEKALEDMARILEISQALAATSDRDELLEQIIKFSLDLLGVERATLFLYDKENHELVANIATGMQELRVPADKGFCGECITTGSTLVIPDAYKDPRFNPEVDKESGFHTRNIMSIPLKGYDGDLVGVLQLLNCKDGAFGDYDITLAETLGAQAGVVIQKANLIEHLLEKQKMERAMQIAREIQQRLLPDKPPQIEGFDVGGLTDPADETGGDIFDFIEMPDGRWAFAVADATGHGIGPALIISETRAMIRASAHLDRSDELAVGHIMSTVNDLLCNDLDGSSFVTCFLGILDPEQNQLTYVSAGHGPMLFYRREKDDFTE
jgi:phosphoserine phosphatase